MFIEVDGGGAHGPSGIRITGADGNVQPHVVLVTIADRIKRAVLHWAT